MSLPAFLLARIDEDEQRIWARIPLLRSYYLSTCRSRREAVALAADWPSRPDVAEDWLKRIARNYRRHPDYREEWKP